MLPFALNAAGGMDGIRERVDAEFFSFTGIGLQSIITYFVVYTLGLLIGQDIWQRVFTAKSPKVARWGGTTAGFYCIIYGAAGAVIGMAAKVALPDIIGADMNKDVVYAEVATELLPVAVGGLVMAAAVAAMMSTASGALIAAATVARTDVTPFVASWFGKSISVNSDENPEHDVRANRIWVLVLGIVTVSLAILVDDVVAALTIAYDILVGGLLVAIIGGLLWKRGNGIGAAASMAAGTLDHIGHHDHSRDPGRTKVSTACTPTIRFTLVSLPPRSPSLSFHRSPGPPPRRSLNIGINVSQVPPQLKASKQASSNN